MQPFCEMEEEEYRRWRVGFERTLPRTQSTRLSAIAPNTWKIDIEQIIRPIHLSTMVIL
jgi:hypothetical protein